MEWNFVKKLKDNNLIKEYEKYINYTFPKDFIDCILSNNGGIPNLKKFNTDNGVEVFKSLKSFNKEDLDNIWKDFDWEGYEEIKKHYGIFASDPFGNEICFDKRNDRIVFLNHETMNVQVIANSFSDLIYNKLY